MSKQIPKRACWNCQDRKIACDRSLPTCVNCLKRNRICAGYGLRLSWPRDGDNRRLVVRGGSDRHKPTYVDHRGSSLHFVNTTVWDVETSGDLGQTGSYAKYANMWPIESLTSSFCPVSCLPVDDGDLISRMTTSVEYDGKGQQTELYDLLRRMALGDDSSSALAVRHAVTSLSMLHNMGAQSDNTRMFRAKAISALRKSISKQHLDQKEALQAMAASILMNVYEIFGCSPSAMGWTVFFCGSKRIAKTIYEYDETYEGDIGILLDWLFYHDVMYKFSIRHWTQRRQEQRELAAEPKIISKELFSPLRNVILPSLGCSLELLDTLARVIDHVRDRDDPLYFSDQHLWSMRALVVRLENLQQKQRVDAANSGSMPQPGIRDRASDMAELYRIACLIYLEKVGLNVTEIPALTKVQERVETALNLLEKLRICERVFPLFVVALEARTDTLVIDETMRDRPFSTQFVSLKRMIEAAWVQDDLNSDDRQELDGLLKYNAVISANRVPPAFI